MSTPEKKECPRCKKFEVCKYTPNPLLADESPKIRLCRKCYDRQREMKVPIKEETCPSCNATAELNFSLDTKEKVCAKCWKQAQKAPQKQCTLCKGVVVEGSAYKLQKWLVRTVVAHKPDLIPFVEQATPDNRVCQSCYRSYWKVKENEESSSPSSKESHSCKGCQIDLRSHVLLENLSNGAITSHHLMYAGICGYWIHVQNVNIVPPQSISVEEIADFLKSRRTYLYLLKEEVSLENVKAHIYRHLRVLYFATDHRSHFYLPKTHLHFDSENFLIEFDQLTAIVPKHPIPIIHPKEFIIQRNIGKGSFGCVDLVTLDGRDQVVIKSANEGKFRSHFCGEINLSSCFQHENIIPFLGASLDPDPFIVYPVMNCDLFVFIAKNPKLPFRTKVSLCVDLCRGVQYLHNLKVMHRDLKPNNILVDEFDKAVITDFGFAALLLPEVYGGRNLFTNLGTDFYKAPEIGPISKYDQKVDIFSLGVTFFYIYSGVQVNVLEPGNILHNRTFPSQDQWLINLIKRCVEKIPQARPSIDELTRTFEKMLAEIK